jgi:hypothetical protein
MVDATEWHEKLRYLSKTVEIVDEFRNWGFTIYRTAYGPSTDQRWQTLLEKIHTKTNAATSRVCQTTADDPAVQQVWSLFQPDARSEPALDDLSMEQLRLLYRNGDGGVPMNADLRSHRVHTPFFILFYIGFCNFIYFISVNISLLLDNYRFTLNMIVNN